ncbi:MAG: hypothetical protein GQF41_1778 [Candidatus Rifleibacterium amylolyticum]|nr:MAG: hypothetical protein GQF41_1778 [Candidatus Rifleibacterium amylolyticum]
MTTITLSIWVGAFITLCCFSFLIKDNPFYRFAEHLFVGVSAGYYFSLISFHQVLKPNLLAKIMPAYFATGQAASAPPEYSLLIPGFLGILMLFRLSASYSWISRFTVAFVMGVSTGLAIVYSTQQFLIPQVAKAIRPIVVAGDYFQSFSNLVLVIGSISCLFYFFFSTEHRGPVYGNVARVGIWFLMISFGASFGATVMGRISLLIGRFQFLLSEWLKIV